MSGDSRTLPVTLTPDGGVKGWGGLGVPGQILLSEDLPELTRGAVLSRGLGRSYGDAALPPPGVTEVVGTKLADRIIAFDPETGLLTAEAGLSLQTVLRVFLPRGWFTPVSPGTQYVTLGGMVGSDVHGKRHHVAGTIGRHVQSIKLRVADGRIVTASRTEHPELFCATLGGMGLTGHILEVSLTMERTPTPWIWEGRQQVPDIDAFVEALREAAGRWPMTVGWIDLLATGASLGRGILMAGRWATEREAPLPDPGPLFRPPVPVRMPDRLINDVTVKVFNELYYRKEVLAKPFGIRHPETFFYPLDAVQHWHRLYGRRGFTQHQCVLPDEAGPRAVRDYVQLVSALGGASPLCVIKDCGPEGEGVLSFPKRGMSVAIDLPVTPDTPDLVRRLNRFVIAHGGRIYLAKDTFTRREDFEAMEGEERLARFEAVRRTWDPDRRIRSALSARLLD